MAAEDFDDARNIVGRGPYGVNVQLSGPLGGGTPNKANLGGSFTYVPHLVGAAAWRTRTFPIL